MAITRRNKKKYAEELGNRKIEDLTKGNLIDLHTRYCLMSGMNDIVIEKYLRIAIENGYTVILIEQVEQPTKGTMVKREETRIESPGTYIENINYNGKNIVVGSLFLSSGDTSYISQTIIDGNQNGSVVTFENGEDSTAILSGILITNGYANEE